MQNSARKHTCDFTANGVRNSGYGSRACPDRKLHHDDNRPIRFILSNFQSMIELLHEQLGARIIRIGIDIAESWLALSQSASARSDGAAARAN